MSLAFTPFSLGRATLSNRIVMAPMTRSRAFGPGATPTEEMVTYYAQRASAGLIITEGTQPSIVGQGYPDTPGLHSAEQVAAWRTVTDAVHAQGGVIYAQLMHAGRIGSADLLPGDLEPVGPSAVAAEGQVYTHLGPQALPVPHVLTGDEIKTTIADFANAARNAIEAGFDGVELHGANGYLIQQFLSTSANQRTDEWGGSIENRARFALEVAAATVEAIGADRVGIRLSPGNPTQSIVEVEVDELYTHLVAGLAKLDLVYVHLLETTRPDLTVTLRAQWPGTFILNTPATDGPDRVAQAEDGRADLVAFGQLFLANPDLPARLAAGGPFNAADHTTYFGGTEKGYTDYPALEQSGAN